ncbi:hypothetical protein GCM10022281_07950 [Sphingomonas rosea]|uniref:HPt domain-containing protein n=1 Tax=Sphingomonas rosea TaxID=335605 RepID=A0ABP7TTQ3_9SPHN
MPHTTTILRELALTADCLDPDTLEALLQSLGAVRYRQLLDLFASELDQRPRAIRAALADRDYAHALSAAHSFRGAAASLGAGAVADAARGLEWAIAAAAEGDRDRVASALYRLQLASEEALRFLEGMSKKARLALAAS